MFMPPRFLTFFFRVHRGIGAVSTELPKHLVVYLLSMTVFLSKSVKNQPLTICIAGKLCHLGVQKYQNGNLY